MPKQLSTAMMAEKHVVAFGDIHGSTSLLEQELEKHYGSGAELLFLGDLIDRSPEPDGDCKVLERVMALQQQPQRWGLRKVTVLRGNHEQMLLDAMAEGGTGSATELWEINGGDPGLLPFFQKFRSWFDSLPLMTIRGRFLFVHAGVRPGVPLHRQRSNDLLWIRKLFLTRPHDLPYTVVHGHSVTADFQIDRLPHRINLDTGAFQSGILSSLHLDPADDAPCSVTL